MAAFKWRSIDGQLDIAANWANTTLRINPARVAPGASDNVSFGPSGGTLTGTEAVAGLSMDGVFAAWTIAGQLEAGTTFIGGLTTVLGGGSLDGGSLTVAGGGSLIVGTSGTLRGSNLTLLAGSTLGLAGSGLAVVGNSAGISGALSVDTAATLTAHGGLIQADIIDNGILSSDSGLTVAGNVTGSGALVLGVGLTDITGSIGVGMVTFGTAASTLRVHGLHGATEVSGFRAGDAIDVTGGDTFALETSVDGTTFTAGGGTLKLGTAPANSAFQVVGDGQGGLKLQLDSPAPPLDPTPPPGSSMPAPTDPTPLPADPVPLPASSVPAPPPDPTPPPGPVDYLQIPASGLVINVAEDAYLGDAQFTVSVDGKQFGGTYTATALHSAGQSQEISVDTVLSSGTHTVGISFINDAWGGSADTDRNLYVTDATYNGQAIAGSTASLMSNGTATFGVTTGPAVTSTATIDVSEDAYLGDAQFTIAVDGKQMGGIYTATATASHAAGNSQGVTLTGITENFTPHDIAVTFLNDAYGGSASTDRNLYVNSIQFDNQSVPGGAAALMSAGTQHFAAVAPANWTG